MTAALAHRGPDAEGHWTDDQAVVLGHRRLSILDTSNAANQPMTSWCGRYVLAFNGEVYNYRELRGELDYPFQTTGDTEVVLAALREWGTAALGRFNGMFALALWDTVYRFPRSDGHQAFVCRPTATVSLASEILRCWHPDGWPSDRPAGPRLPAIPDCPRSAR